MRNIRKSHIGSAWSSHSFYLSADTKTFVGTYYGIRFESGKYTDGWGQTLNTRSLQSSWTMKAWRCPATTLKTWLTSAPTGTFFTVGQDEDTETAAIRIWGGCQVQGDLLASLWWWFVVIIPVSILRIMCFENAWQYIEKQVTERKVSLFLKMMIIRELTDMLSLISYHKTSKPCCNSAVLCFTDYSWLPDMSQTVSVQTNKLSSSILGLHFKEWPFFNKVCACAFLTVRNPAEMSRQC